MRALQTQIQTRISAEMKDALDRTCKARKVSQGAIIDEALAAMFSPDPQEETKIDIILDMLRMIQEKLTGMEQGQQRHALVGEPNNVVPNTSDPMAFYANLAKATREAQAMHESGAVEVAPQPSEPSRLGRLRRLFMKG